MSSTLLGALIAEGVSSCLDQRRVSRGNFAAPFLRIFREAVSPVLLPDTARFRLALYGPAFAFAALLPICASIPFCTVVPVLDNGGDLVQIFQFALLSDILAVVSLHSLGTASGREAARARFRDSACMMIVVMSCFASLSWYLEATGVSGDTFSLNTLSLVLRDASVNAGVVAGIILFIFLILGMCGGETGFQRDGELAEYRGAQRAILSLWSVFRTFIIVALVTHIFFPWALFQPSGASAQSISWYMQALNFIMFWIAVIAVRVLLVPLCGRVLGFAHDRLFAPRYAWLLLPCLTLFAISLVMYAAVSIAAEVASF